MNNYQEKCLPGTSLAIKLFEDRILSLKNVVMHVQLLLISLSSMTGLERVKFFTNTSIKVAIAFFLLESLRLKVR